MKVKQSGSRLLIGRGEASSTRKGIIKKEDSRPHTFTRADNENVGNRYREVRRVTGYKSLTVRLWQRTSVLETFGRQLVQRFTYDSRSV